MSRGPGRTQRRVLEELRRYYDDADPELRDRWYPNASWNDRSQYPGQTTLELAALVYDVGAPSPAQIRTVRRAIARLHATDEHVWIAYGSVATQPRGNRRHAAVPGQHVRWMPTERSAAGSSSHRGAYTKSAVSRDIAGR